MQNVKGGMNTLRREDGVIFISCLNVANVRWRSVLARFGTVGTAAAGLTVPDELYASEQRFRLGKKTSQWGYTVQYNAASLTVFIINLTMCYIYN